jgi:hypothetical protein
MRWQYEIGPRGTRNYGANATTIHETVAMTMRVVRSRITTGGRGIFRDWKRLTEALKQLVRLYTDWEKPEQAAQWQKELDSSDPD